MPQREHWRAFEFALKRDQAHGQIVRDAPVAVVQRIRERRAGRRDRHAQAALLGSVKVRTGLGLALPGGLRVCFVMNIFAYGGGSPKV